MGKVDPIQALYAKKIDPSTFNFDTMMAPPLFSLISPMAVQQIHSIITSLKYSGKLKQKTEMIKSILAPFGWIRFGSGTNRMVFRNRDLPDLLIKVALDKVGLGDSHAEFKNQQYLKPFVAKTFEVSPCGTVALVERVIPITTVDEFLDISDDIYNLITIKILGRYVLEDIGSHYFMNYGVRLGFGPVLLDYPYVYRLDVNKLYCNAPMPDGSYCGGIIDYDAGFNRLFCQKCGKKYLARELKKNISENILKVEDMEENTKLKVTLKKNGKTYNYINESDFIE